MRRVRRGDMHVHHIHDNVNVSINMARTIPHVRLRCIPRCPVIPAFRCRCWAASTPSSSTGVAVASQLSCGRSRAGLLGVAATFREARPSCMVWSLW